MIQRRGEAVSRNQPNLTQQRTAEVCDIGGTLDSEFIQKESEPMLEVKIQRTKSVSKENGFIKIENHHDQGIASMFDNVAD